VLRIIATVPVFNEADILEQVLDHLRQNGIFFVVLDGGSHDDSAEIAQSYEGRGLLEFQIVNRGWMVWEEDLTYLLQMARSHQPDWIVKNDADESLEPPEVGHTLHDAITRENRLGFSVIQFNHYLFYLTEKEYRSTERDIRSRLRFYRSKDDFRYSASRYDDDSKWHLTSKTGRALASLAYPTREELLLLANLQEHSGLLSFDPTRRILRFAKHTADKFLLTRQMPGKVCRRLRTMLNQAISRVSSRDLTS